MTVQQDNQDEIMDLIEHCDKVKFKECVAQTSLIIQNVNNIMTPPTAASVTEDHSKKLSHLLFLLGI